MRKFRVTVNGQAYDVVVEEYGEAAPMTAPAVSVRPTQYVSAPKAPAAPPVSPAPPSPPPAAAKPAPPPKPVSQPVVGGTAVSAPMPGVILNVLVSAGQAVKAGEVLLILEAMKMENEVTSPATGTVKEVAVSKGSNVNTGDLMVVIE
jgi:glutaconyl-CoA/methylmalonyl-CoA decarboxylase subunit gamma